MGGLDNFLDATGKVLETFPKAYDDVLQPAAKETGILLGRVPKEINAACAGIDIWITRKEYNVEKTKKLLAKELENVEPEKIVPPDPYIAVPAFQAISYCMDSEELRTMYAKLLANSMNEDTKNKVMPAYVEIIKQMSPSDAEFCKSLFTDDGIEIDRNCVVFFSLCHIHAATNDKSNTLYKNYCLNDNNELIKPGILDNLRRLGLIEFMPQGHCLIGVSYDAYYEHPLYTSINKTFKTTLENLGSNVSIELEKSGFSVTSFGIDFAYICII